MNPLKCELCHRPATDGDILCFMCLRGYDPAPPPAEVLRPLVIDPSFLRGIFGPVFAARFEGDE